MLCKIKPFLKNIWEPISQRPQITKDLDVYRKIIDSTDDMIIVYEAESGLIKLFNHAVIKKLGYSQEELKNLTIFDIVQLDPQQLRHNIDRVVRNGEVIRGRRFYKSIYGEPMPVEIVATKVELNHVPHILVVARDISELLKLEEELRKKSERVELLHDFLLNLNRSASEGEAYNLLSHILLKFLDIDTVAVYKVNPSPNKVVDALIYGNPNYVKCLEKGEEPIACKVFQSPEPFVVKDRLSYSCPLQRSEYGSYMCIPVVSAGRVIALVSLISEKEKFFDKEKVEFIRDIFNAFSHFLSNLRLIEINRELSITDPLTGLYNRRFILEFLQKEIERAKRKASPLSVVLADLDHFKEINDTYGHQVGDLCLKTFAEVLKSNVRQSDVVGRWGGEEFILILPDTGRSQAVEIAERIRRALKGKVVYTEDARPVHFTSSFGISVYPEDGEDLDTLIKVADDKLYLAKKEGRDMVIP